jgi:hypothetical protein
MNETLTIKKGGKLARTGWKGDTWVTEDVTDRAISLLFEQCDLEEGVTLRDLFLLLNTELEIFDCVLGNWCKEIVQEGLAAPSTRNLGFDKLELYWHIGTTTEDGKTRLFGHHFPEFHGVGKADENDRYYPVGERISYSLSFLSSSDLVDLPLELCTESKLFDEDDWQKQPTPLGEAPFTLGQILYGVLWELSFYGAPEDRDARGEELRAAAASFALLQRKEST